MSANTRMERADQMHVNACPLCVISAEEGAADAVGYSVEATGGAVVDQVFAGHGHGGTGGVVIGPYQGGVRAVRAARPRIESRSRFRRRAHWESPGSPSKRTKRGSPTPRAGGIGRALGVLGEGDQWRFLAPRQRGGSLPDFTTGRIVFKGNPA